MLLFLLFLCVARSYHIVFIGPEMRGHWTVFSNVAHEAVKRGHKVTFIAPEVVFDFSIMKNFPNAEKIAAGKGRTPEEKEEFDREGTEAGVYKMLTELIPKEIQHTQIIADKVLESAKTRDFDVCFVDGFVDAGISACDYLGIPAVVSFGTDVPQFWEGTIREDEFTFMTSYKTGRSIMGRTVGFALHKPLPTIMASIVIHGTASYRTRIGLPPNSITNMLDGHVIISNGFAPFNSAGPVPANFIRVGPMFSDKQIEIGTEYEALLNTGLPVLYVSMGSQTILTAEQIQFFVKALKSDKFRVLWSLRKSQQALIAGRAPDNIILKAWVPQKAVINHPNVFCVITHGGAGGVFESIDAGKPMIFRPNFGDQFMMASQGVKNGIGFHFPETTFELRSIVTEVLNNKETYHQKVLKIAEFGKFAGGVGRAMNVLEMIAKHGPEGFLPKYKDQTIIERMNLDILFVLLGFYTCILFLCAQCCKCYLCKRRDGKEKQE